MFRLILLRNFLIITSLFILYSCSNIKVKQNRDFIALNTTCKITIFDFERINYDEIIDLIDKYESLLSAHRVGSDIYIINSLAGEKFYTPDRLTLELIKKGIEFCELSRGEFDISIGPLVNLWDVGERSSVPDSNKIKLLTNLVNYKNIIIKDDGSVMLERAGMAIDLGAIAKGYIATLVKKHLIELGVKSAIINLGGNIDIIGMRPDGKNWNIGIQHPRKPHGEFVGILSTNNLSIVSSGDYERFFEGDGVRYHHILDPFTGYPRDGDIIGSTVITSDSLDCDGLSTITFGKDIRYIKELRSRKDFEGVFVLRDKTVYITPGLVNSFTLKDETYKIIP